MRDTPAPLAANETQRLDAVMSHDWIDEPRNGESAVRAIEFSLSVRSRVLPVRLDPAVGHYGPDTDGARGKSHHSADRSPSRGDVMPERLQHQPFQQERTS